MTDSRLSGDHRIDLAILFLLSVYLGMQIGERVFA